MVAKLGVVLSGDGHACARVRGASIGVLLGMAARQVGWEEG